jgi:hypothetical protein
MILSVMIKIAQKTHYEYKLDRKMIHNDFAEQYVNFLEDGYWFKDDFEIVPINEIKDENVWNQQRYETIMQSLEHNMALPPVKLYYDEELKEYRLSDGIHRYNVSKKMGFTHIPAIVTRKIIGIPPEIKNNSKILEIQLRRLIQKEIINELKKNKKLDILNPQYFIKLKNNIAILEIDCYNFTKIEELIKVKLILGDVKIAQFYSKFINNKIRAFSMTTILQFITENLLKVIEQYGRNI